MLKRIAATAAATVAAVGMLGAGTTAAHAKTAQATAARPAQRVKVINLHHDYAARLGHTRPGKIAGIVYARGHRPKAAQQATASCTEPNCPMTYGGGPVQHAPRVYLLLWGPKWSSDAGQAASAAYLRDFYSGLGMHPQDTWSTITAQYSDGTGFPTWPGSVYVGAWQDITTPPTGVTQPELAAEADAFTSAEGIADPADAQIIVAT